jgi:hypothetical protein
MRQSVAQVRATQLVHGMRTTQPYGTASPTAVSGENIRHHLSSSAVREPGTPATTRGDSPPSQLSFGGRTYVRTDLSVRFFGEAEDDQTSFIPSSKVQSKFY